MRAGVSVSNLRCWVGPCAEASRYEVGSDTAGFFRAWPEAILPHPEDPKKRLLNVRAVVVEQVLRAGVAPEHVTVSRGGTIGETRYHSHRRCRWAAGRMAAFVTLG
jgi:copper oxidase (laccase) domain-containing protein